MDLKENRELDNKLKVNMQLQREYYEQVDTTEAANKVLPVSAKAWAKVVSVSWLICRASQKEHLRMSTKRR